MLASDDTAKALLERYKIPMPNQNLSPEEIRQLMRYFRWADEHPLPGRLDAVRDRQGTERLTPCSDDAPS